MRYDYKCVKCGDIEEVDHRISETPEVTCGCGGKMERQISLGGGGFIIKGGTSSIHSREKAHRTKMNEAAGVRMKERYSDGAKITPNIAGVRQDSWSDCQKLAKESGMNSKSFQPMVDKEKKKKIQIVKS